MVRQLLSTRSAAILVPFFCHDAIYIQIACLRRDRTQQFAQMRAKAKAKLAAWASGCKDTSKKACLVGFSDSYDAPGDDGCKEEWRPLR